MVLTLSLALLLEYALADPPNRWHPVAWFGCLASFLEQHCYADSRQRGALLCALLLCSCGSLLVLLHQMLGGLADALMLWLSIGWKSLFQHVRQVLEAGDTEEARAAVSRIVSRDTQAMSRTDCQRAALESLAENASDAVLAPLFWFALLGAPGAACYRMVNTLDAMWGYRTPPYRHFGWCAARLDDALNWLPARLTAVAIVFCGRRCCWHQLAEQARSHASPNAGWPEAALAHAASIRLGGPVWRQGKLDHRPAYGPPQPSGHPDDAITCIRHALLLFVGLLLLGLV